MKEFIFNVYSSEYFAIGLFIAIAVLTLAFFVVLILAIKDARKDDQEDEMENYQPPMPPVQNVIEERVNEPLINTSDFAFTKEVQMPTPEIPNQVAPQVTIPPIKKEIDLESVILDINRKIDELDAKDDEPEPVLPADNEVNLANIEAIIDRKIAELEAGGPEQSNNFTEPQVLPKEEFNPFLTSNAAPKAEDLVFPLPEKAPFVVQDPFEVKNQEPIAPLPTSEFTIEPEKITDLSDINPPMPLEEPLKRPAPMPLPEQFSSVYVDHKEEPDKETIEFEIKQPYVNIPQSGPEVKPQQVSQANPVISQMPKLATNTSAQMVMEEKPAEVSFNSFTGIENETYQINRRQ